MTPPTPFRPPPSLERLLRHLLPSGVEGESILGDLREEATRRGPAPRPLLLAFWSRRACGLAAAFGASRLASAAANFPQGVARAGRGLLRAPGTAVAGVAVIALGTGISTTMAAVAYGLFLRDLDVPEAHELRAVEYRDPLAPGETAPPDVLRAWRDAPGPFRRVAGFRTGRVNLGAGGDGAEVRSAAWITPDAFDLLGVAPTRGRGFVDGDAAGGDPRAVLLSHALWTDRFEGADILGTDVRVEGRPLRVVGVMPPGFAFPMRQELWLPALPWLEGTEAAGLVAFGRLRPGVDEAAAGRHLESVLAALRPGEVGERTGGAGVAVVRFNELRGGSVLRPLLGSMTVAALLVLLVSSANVAGLLLARTTARIREVGVRAALGAGRVRTALPFLAEGAVLAVAGTLAGLGLALWATNRFETVAAAAGKPYWMHVRVDAPLLFVAAGITLLVAVVAAAGPVVVALRSDPATLLRAGRRSGGGPGPGRLGHGLVVVQIALSCALLVGTGLVARSLAALTAMDFPFARADVVVADVRPPAAEYPDAPDRAALFDALAAEAASAPGVEHAELAFGLPSLAHRQFALEAEGAVAARRDDLPRAWRAAGTPGLLRMIRMEPHRGRGFRRADDAAGPAVAVVEADLAAALFGDRDPLGLRFREVGEGGAGPWREVVGVTDDLRLEGITDLDEGTGYYVPLAQVDVPTVTLLVEGGTDVGALSATVREVVHSVDPDVAVTDVKTLRAMVGESSFFYEVFGGFFATFGVAGLLVACVGLSGLLSWSVARKVPELGIRMALGATPRSVMALVLRDAALQASIGLVAGLALAALAGDALRVLLFRVDPRDPLVYAAVVAAVGAVSLLAAAAPALRASRLDPVEALRAE